LFQILRQPSFFEKKGQLTVVVPVLLKTRIAQIGKDFMEMRTSE